jgi:hypothetical protein
MKSKISGVALLFLLTTCTWTGCSIDAQGNRVIGGPGFGEATIYEKPALPLELKIGQM